MNILTLPNPKSTKHRALYEAVNKLIEQAGDGYTVDPGTKSWCRGGASPSNKATKLPEHKCCIHCSVDGNSHAPHSGGCLNETLNPPKPHWESDYAAIWEKYDDDWNYSEDDVRQDILELIRRVAN